MFIIKGLKMVKKLGLALGLGVVLILGYAVYSQATKSGCRAMRLDCHKETVVFERVYLQDEVEALKEAVQSKGIKLELETQKAHYSPSKLFEILDLEAVRRDTLKAFGEASSQEAVRLHVLIYENDPLDPGKKTKEAKLYAGYLVFSFYKGADLVYKIQIDFMDKEGKDIAKRITCAQASLMAL